MKKPLHISIPITKVDEEQRTVYGYATVEEIDSHGEMITFEASKKAFSNWIGNIREMHEAKAVGKAIQIEFDEDAKGIWLGARISESEDGEQAWTKIKEGVYAGFSIGGNINDMTVREMSVDGKKQMVPVITDYTLGETSIVDNPAVASAVFQMVRNTPSGLLHVEKMTKKPARPIHWWEKVYKYSDKQDIMKASVITYNENSMAGKKSDITKSIWEAGMLVDLAMMLSDYIYWKAWDGEDVSGLKDALQTIQDEAAKEIKKPENFPDDVEKAIKAATSALNITKKEELVSMSEQAKNRQKSVVGQPDRNENGEEVVSAEENTVTPAPANPPADPNEDVNPDEDPKDTAETPEDEPKDEPKDEDPKDNPEDEPKDEEKGKGKGKKSASAEFVKFSKEDLTKAITSAVEDATAPLKEKISKLEKQAAPSKVKSSYTVKKGEDVETPGEDQQDAAKKEMDKLLKRADELAADPQAGTHEERLRVAFQLRKASRQMDPASRAKHEAIKSTFKEAK